MSIEAILTVNGKRRAFAAQSIAEIVADFGVDPARKGVAVAVNAKLVPRAAWAETRLSPGDKVEIVRPLAGG
jgi:sulfur carrier protein